jgi:hypothetical protein
MSFSDVIPSRTEWLRRLSGKSLNALLAMAQVFPIP